MPTASEIINSPWVKFNDLTYEPGDIISVLALMEREGPVIAQCCVTHDRRFFFRNDTVVVPTEGHGHLYFNMTRRTAK